MLSGHTDSMGVSAKARSIAMPPLTERKLLNFINLSKLFRK